MDNLLSTLKLLADGTRLNILGLLAQTPRTGDELAALLDIQPSTISHHLTRMQKAGLVSAKAEQYYHTYSLEPQPLRQVGSMLTVTHLAERAQKSDIVDSNAYRQQILARWVKDERLSALPTQIKQRRVVLEWLAHKFAQDLRYGPQQRDDVLNQWCSWRDPRAIDITSVERALVEEKLLARTRDGRWCWRMDSPLVQGMAQDGATLEPAMLPAANTSDIHIAFRVSPLLALIRIAIRIKSNRPFSAAEVDEMIQAFRKTDEADANLLRLQMVEQSLLTTTADDLYVRPTLTPDHPAMQKLRIEAIERGSLTTV